MGQTESPASAGARHSRHAKVGQRDWPLFHSSPTRKLALAAEVKVGLLAVSVRTRDVCDQLLPLRSSPYVTPAANEIASEASTMSPS